MSEERLLRSLCESESVKENEKNFDNTIEKIKIDFMELRDKFLKPKIKKITKDIHRIKTKNLSTPKIRRIEERLFKLENNLSLKKYYDHDDIEYREIRDAKKLFDLSINEGCYKPIISNEAFNNNYFEYENKKDKYKILSMKEYLNMIKPYLRDIISDHKTLGE